MRRGFKAEAKALALELRQEVGCDLLATFDPWALAKLYGVAVYDLDDLNCANEAREHFTVTRIAVFSGALVPLSQGQVILENPGHQLVRRRSTVSHEMAHVTLEHAFAATMVNERGCRSAVPGQEAEAAELSGELLIPFDAAVHLASRHATDDEAADQFGVSNQVAGWRLNGSGARKIQTRREAAYQRKVAHNR